MRPHLYNAETDTDKRYAETDTDKRGSGFSLNELETSSNSAFELLDADENGSITLDEIDLFKEKSEASMSIEELTSRGRRSGTINHYFWTEEEINSFEVGDTNGDGSMNREEFDNLASNIRTHVLELGLKSLDTDKNGSVEVNEFTAHLDSFKEWDEDGNGSIDRGEIAGITDRRVQIDLHHDIFDRRITAEIQILTAERERRAAGRSRSVYLFDGVTANIDEMREASKHTFNVLDADNSGFITLDEIDITAELIEGEENLPPEKLAELRRRSNIISYKFMDVEEKVDSFKVADTNHDGVLSETEFDLRGTTVRTHILKLNLDSYDNDKNGSVELREFSAHLDNTEEIDADGDGNISREELLGSSDVKLQLQLDVQINQSAAFDRARAVESQSQ